MHGATTKTISTLEFFIIEAMYNMLSCTQ